MTDRIAAGMMAFAVALPATAAVLPPTPATPAAELARFIKVPAGRIALTHIRVIDGTGAAPRADQTILIDAGRIVSVAPTRAKPPAGATIIDMTGRTALPGLVGMHNHLFYMARPNTSTAAPRGQPLPLLPEMLFSSPRLYLANGVTTIRTTGSVEPDGDLGIKRQIDAGRQPGPNIDMTAPYVEGAGSIFPQMPEITTAAGARAHVEYWAGRGANSIKIYNNVTREVLKATIEAAHARGIKVTGHLCSITYPEAVDAGIDNLEHGFYANTQLDPGKTADTCSASRGEATLLAMTPETPEAKALIAALVAHKMTLTSTLPVFEYGEREFPAISAGARGALSPQAQADLAVRAAAYTAGPEARRASLAKRFANEAALERAFVAAGGMMMAGPDPTGAGDVVPGFGDLHGIELLVGAGFSPAEAIRIATLNGAHYLGLDSQIGSIAPGKHADILVVEGNPASRIADIEQVEIVFKDGIGWDSKALLGSVAGRYGKY